MTVQTRARTAAPALIVLCAFTVPLPAAWISGATALFLLVWLAGGDFAARWQRVRQHRVALLSLIMFGWMGLSVLWSPAPWRSSVDDWWHYREFLLIPLMVSAIEDRRWLRRILIGLIAGFVVALVVSFLRRFGVMPVRGDGLYAGFGGHTGFSTVAAFVVFSCFWLWRSEPRWRTAWALLGAITLLNLFAINTGRTGQLIFLFLVPLMAYRWLGFKGVAAGALGGVLLAAGLYAVVPKVHERIDVSINDIQQFRQGNTDTNDGIRMEFWKNSATLIARHPVFGGGTGSFRPEYRALAEGQGLEGIHITPNPHNEYLLIWSQTGLVGLALLVWLWSAQWRHARRLGQTERYLTHGLLVCMIVGDAFNSFILDNFEGHFYALMTVALAHAWLKTRDA